MEHIEVEGSAGVYHVAEKSGKLVGFACVMTVVPVVEPSAPVFTAHMRLIRAEFFEHCEVFHGMGAEVCHAEVIRKSTAAEHPPASTVGSEKSYVNSAFTVDVLYGAEIFLVVAV